MDPRARDDLMATEELDPRAPALDLATEVVDATFEVHMGGGLLPAAQPVRHRRGRGRRDRLLTSQRPKWLAGLANEQEAMSDEY